MFLRHFIPPLSIFLRVKFLHFACTQKHTNIMSSQSASTTNLWICLTIALALTNLATLTYYRHSTSTTPTETNDKGDKDDRGDDTALEQTHTVTLINDENKEESLPTTPKGEQE